MRQPRIRTAIWYEAPSEDNPYVARQHVVRGRPLLELCESSRFSAAWHLLFRGTQPTPAEAELLEFFMIAMIGPGPRHPASRAVVAAAASMTVPVNLLPIGAALLGGEHHGGLEVRACARFLTTHMQRDPRAVAERCLAEMPPADEAGQRPVAPGFGTTFGSPDPWAAELLARIAALEGAGPRLRWVEGFARAIGDAGAGPRVSAIAAAVLCDLGFEPWAAAALFQLLQLHGVLASGLEYVGQRPDALPFLQDCDYVIED